MATILDRSSSRSPVCTAGGQRDTVKGLLVAASRTGFACFCFERNWNYESERERVGRQRRIFGRSRWDWERSGGAFGADAMDLAGTSGAQRAGNVGRAPHVAGAGGVCAGDQFA